MNLKLSDLQIASFDYEGVLLIDQLIDPLLADKIAERYKQLFRGEFETGVQPDEINWQEDESSKDFTRQICNGWKADRTLARVVLREDIGKVGATLAHWPGARVMQDNVIWKPVGARPIGFHQDNSYLNWFSPSETLTCWIALDDTTAEGGTMEVVRGSHRWGKSLIETQFHGPETYRQDMEAAARAIGKSPEIIPIVVPKGGGSFHHGWTWHGSDFNKSDKTRRSLVIHMCSSEARFKKESLGSGTGSIYARYHRLSDDIMDENYFPILWTKDGRRTSSIENYLNIR